MMAVVYAKSNCLAAGSLLPELLAVLPSEDGSTPTVLNLVRHEGGDGVLPPAALAGVLSSDEVPAASRVILNRKGDTALLLTLTGLFLIRLPAHARHASFLTFSRPPSE